MRWFYPVLCRCRESSGLHLIQQIPQESVPPLPSRGRLSSKAADKVARRWPNSVRPSSLFAAAFLPLILS